MVEAEEFVEVLAERGFGPCIAVPCSFLTGLIDCVLDSSHLEYIAANNEGEAIAVAAGASLAGRKPIVMFQNSGLGNAVNPLSSLTYTFRIAFPLIVTWRGQPGRKDEPQHDLMGQITETILRSLHIGYDFFPEHLREIADRIDRTEQQMRFNSLPHALIMKHGSVAPYDRRRAQPAANNRERGTIIVANGLPCTGPRLARREAIEIVVDSIPENAVVIATTGLASRELYYYRERPGNLYVVGSMGCASSLGLGIALYQANRPVVVLDGDGAALMRLEAMASVGHYRPGNLTHVILDNGVYDSTGGQASLADSVSFGGVAIACGYSSATSVVQSRDLHRAVDRCVTSEGPHLIHTRIVPNAGTEIGRPTLTPIEIKERFVAFLSGRMEEIH